ncbi:MAG TPA: hypothetical protein VD864_01020 [Nocardioides sp.]|nr:hypothetical protein [Nocardioides sp.]
MTDKTSDTGLWLTDDGKVVKKQPKGGGTQLVRPGGAITAAAQLRIDSASADPDAKPIPAHEALGNPVEVAIDDEPVEKTVTTDAAKPAKRTAKKS